MKFLNFLTLVFFASMSAEIQPPNPEGKGIEMEPPPPIPSNMVVSTESDAEKTAPPMLAGKMEDVPPPSVPKSFDDRHEIPTPPPPMKDKLERPKEGDQDLSQEKEKFDHPAIPSRPEQDRVDQNLSEDSKRPKTDDRFDERDKEMPKPPSEVTKPKNVRLPNIDTTKVGNQGNWLLKKVWFEQAEDTFGKILDARDKIIQQQIKLFKSVTSAGKDSESNFKNINIEPDEIKSIITNLQMIEKKDDSGKAEASMVRDIKELIAEHKSALDSLNKSSSKQIEIEASISAVVDQVIAQINRARTMQSDAWTDFKEIGNTLNDETAKKLFYKMEGYSQTLSKIDSYLSGSLNSYLQSLFDQSSTLAKEITTQFEKLDQDGLNLVKAEEIIT